MRTFSCQCGNRLYFENFQCVACGREVGWCEGCSELGSLTPVNNDAYTCDNCGCTIHKCRNNSIELVCNRLCVGECPNGEHTLCTVCKLTETIPDLSIEGNRDKWLRLEQAKRRLIFQLDLLNLPYRNVAIPLSFDFKGHVLSAEDVWRKGEPAEHVYTGHADGKITINIQEADDVEREKLRVDLNESQRTLIGHFRHEIGHYYWQLLVQGVQEESYIAIFGDHNNPDYATAMAQYYQQGPRMDWNLNFISAYASSHSWEDFAETFALYLDIRSIIDTAQHLRVPLPKIGEPADFEEYVAAYQKLGLIVNELNRCMGIFDLVPEVIASPVVGKLEFIHGLVHNAATLAKKAASPGQATVVEITKRDSKLATTA